MILYLLTRLDRTTYSEALGFVIAAPDEASARAVPFTLWMVGGGHGDGGCGGECGHIGEWEVDGDEPQRPCAWADPARTRCVPLGGALADVAGGVVLRSYANG